MALWPDIHKMHSLSQEIYEPVRWKPLLKRSEMMDVLLLHEYLFLTAKKTGRISSV